MTDEERLAALEKTVQGFNLVVKGTNQIAGGFPQLKSQPSFAERLTHLESLHDNFQIIGGSNVTVEGSLQTGYAICATCPGATGPVGGGGGGGGPPPVHIGACCKGGVCSITNQQECVNSGGTYQGDGTTCTPNPCPQQTGACCFTDFTCIDGVTLVECTNAGGTYLGDGTDCDPPPCCPSVCSDWRNFIGTLDGLRWKTRTLHTTITTFVSGPSGYFCNLSWDTTSIGRIDPDTCIESIECSGTINWTGSESPFSISEVWQHGTDTCFGSPECCQRVPLDSIPGCAGDVGACSLGYNQIPVWPDHAGWSSITATEATITGSSHGSSGGYTWDCEARTTDTLTELIFSPC